MTAEAFRKLALSLPDTSEAAHMGHPDFRVGGRIFATLGYPDRSCGMVKLPPPEQEAFVASDPAVFQPVKGGWGLQGCTTVRLAPATESVVRRALFSAWRGTAPKRLVREVEDQ